MWRFCEGHWGRQELWALIHSLDTVLDFWRDATEWAMTSTSRVLAGLRGGVHLMKFEMFG